MKAMPGVQVPHSQAEEDADNESIRRKFEMMCNSANVRII